MPTTVRAALNASAAGVLLFLLWDVLSHAVEPVETALNNATGGSGSWWRFAGLAAVLAVGLAVGLLAFVRYDSWAAVRRSEPVEDRRFGPGAMAADELHVIRRTGLSPAHRLAVLIAAGIGLHNFSEGLAIGQSSANGETSLALMLVIGFALHNATEGFGITAPLAAEADRPSWAFLAALGVLGGGPTFVGTLVGRSFVNDTLYLGFLALAAGSILYVLLQLFRVAERLGHRHLLYWGLLAGLLAGLATDFIVTAAGA